MRRVTNGGSEWPWPTSAAPEQRPAAEPRSSSRGMFRCAGSQRTPIRTPTGDGSVSGRRKGSLQLDDEGGSQTPEGSARARILIICIGELVSCVLILHNGVWTVHELPGRGGMYFRPLSYRSSKRCNATTSDKRWSIIRYLQTLGEIQ